MNAARGGRSLPLYCLRGEVAGAPRRYLLAAGTNSVGSGASNDIVLAEARVSRRHACVSHDAGRWTVEDLSSRNGTFVNGCRVQRSLLAPGDELRFAGVSLRFEPLPLAEGTLAVSLERDSGASGAAPAREGRAGNRASGPPATRPIDAEGVFDASTLDFVERFAARVWSPAAPDPAQAPALGLLVERCGASGACLFEALGDSDAARPTEPVVLSSAGLPCEGVVEEALRRWHETGPTVGAVASLAWATGGEPMHTEAYAAVLRSSDGGAFGLVAWGVPGRLPAGADLLRAALLILRLAQPRGASAREIHDPAGQPRRLVFPEGHLPACSEAMQALYEQARCIADDEAPVLITGETGVGKEGLARALHLSSRRRTAPWVAVNCAAIPADLLEAEMFGVARGAATGVAERPGRFQQAHGGTLFLDEIAELALALQAKLLRTLQEREVCPLGGRPVPVDVRVVSATNRDLRDRNEAARLRRDLFYRLAGLTLDVPPLRQRREDVPPLAEALLRRVARETGREIRGLTAGALGALSSHDWPGNVRELDHVMRRLAYACAPGAVIDSDMVARALGRPAAPGGSSPAGDSAAARLAGEIAALERDRIAGALARAGGNRSEAARLLGVSRNGLAYRMKRLGLRD